MYKLSDILGDYEEPEKIKTVKLGDKAPIASPKDSSWTKHLDPERLTRIFKFDDEGKFNEFIVEVLEYQADCGHHGRITMQYPQVKLEIWTHTLHQLTELDFEWTEQVDKIYGDYSG